jgi:hypothetical protein
VIVFGEDPREWDVVFTEFRWLFGEGHEESPGESPPAAAPTAPGAKGTDGTADLGEQIAAVFAQHADKLGRAKP